MARKEKTSIPNAGANQPSRLIEAVVKDLAPELLKQPLAIALIMRFVCPGQQKPLSLRTLERELKPFLSPSTKAHKDILLTSIEGMKTSRETFHLKNMEELDIWIQCTLDEICKKMELNESETKPGRASTRPSFNARGRSA